MSRIALIDPETLLGKELRELLEPRDDLVSDLRLLATGEEDFATLTTVGDAAAVVTRVSPLELEGIDLAIFCGTMESTRPLLGALPAETTAIVLSPDATPEDGRAVIAGLNDEAVEPGTVLVSPHPAAILLGHLLAASADLEPRQAVATIIEPTSVFGETGLDELLEDTRRVLSMRGEPEEPFFGRQLAFNLLPSQRRGATVVRQLEACLAERVPTTVQLLQGAVFHGLSASLWLHLGKETVTPEGVTEILATSPRIEVAPEPELLGPIDATRSSSLVVGEVRADHSSAGGFWIWSVMDNLVRGGAVNAVEIAEALL